MPNNEISDLSGVGKIVDSKVVRETYKDAVSPAMKEFGILSEESVKTFRLFTAPIQLLAAYQDRFSGFCDRVRNRVPEDFQRTAAANIAKPVMEAIAFTEDESVLMEMFEELMSKAIDVREAEKLSPSFPKLIKNLTPLQAKLLKSLQTENQVTDYLMDGENNQIIKSISSNFDLDDFSGISHHLTLIQDLKVKNLVQTTFKRHQEKTEKYYEYKLEDGQQIDTSTTNLSMFGWWFVNTCIGEK